MFGIGLGEIIIIVFALLIILGPRQLQEISKAIGKAINELNRMKADFIESINASLREDEEIPAPEYFDFKEASSVVPVEYCSISDTSKSCDQFRPREDEA